MSLPQQQGPGQGAGENQPAPAAAEPLADNGPAAEVPDIQVDPAEDMELEDEAGAEDVGDANNGAQGMNLRMERF
jgi:hypothetical protein